MEKVKAPQKVLVEREVRLWNDCFTVDEFNAYAAEHIAQVPEEFRASVRFEIKSVHEMYEEHPTTGFYMTYREYETDDEYNARVQQESQIQNLREEHERREFERLSKKFSKEGS